VIALARGRLADNLPPALAKPRGVVSGKGGAFAAKTLVFVRSVVHKNHPVPRN
jgi:hypothetical protein